MNLIHGECLEQMDELIAQGVIVDAIITDPPYGTTACKWDSVIPFDEMWIRLNKLIKPNGAIVLFWSQPFTTKLINSNIEKFSHQWIWQKEQWANPLLANIMPMKNFEDIIVFVNEYKNYDYENKNPLREYFKEVMEFIGLTKKRIIDKIGQKADHTFRVNSTQYWLCTEKTYLEIIEVFWIDKMGGFKSFEELQELNNSFNKTLEKFERVYNPQKTKWTKYKSWSWFMKHTWTFKDWWTISDERYPTCIIKFNTEKSKSQHPTQKPVALMEYLIKTYTNENETVLDFTSGSFSTCVAADNTNRKWIGIEMSDEYCKIWKERLIKNRLDNKLDLLDFTILNKPV